MNRAWRLAPREVDLLSWFTGPLVPVVFGAVAMAFGIAMTVQLNHGGLRLALAIVALAVMAIAFCSVMYLAPRRRAKLRTAVTVVPISIGWIALLLGYISEWATSIPFEDRWSPVALGFLIASLAPYLSALRIVFIGASSFLVSISLTVLSLTVHPQPGYWPTAVELLMGGTAILIASTAAAAFSFQVVSRTMRWATSVPGNALSSGVLGEAARQRILRQELASVSERTLPLFERVIATGVVTESDRVEAKALAESIRSELVRRSNLSWLESLTRQMNLIVIDQDRLADQMKLDQRTALLGLLTAATKNVFDGSARVVIELRPEADGATAVAISADRDLADGRKLTLLAPHYVSLAATVDGGEWGSADSLQMSFRVPPNRKL